MAYADQEMSGNKIVAIIIVALIHIVLGYVLITGLAYEAAKHVVERVTTVDIEEEVEEPEEEPPPPPPEEVPEYVPPVFVPPNPMNLNQQRRETPPRPPIPQEPARQPTTKDCGGGRIVPAGQSCEIPTKRCPDGLGGFSTVPQNAQCPEQMKRCDYGGPVRASQQCAEKPKPKVKLKPRNNPGGWINNNDYKTSWVNRDYQGTVSFTVSVGDNGRVQSCSVTGGSAPSALKDASCRLIQRRARFNKNAAGSYSNTVKWQIPK